MGFSSYGRKGNDKAVADMLRSIIQDALHNFELDTLHPIFVDRPDEGLFGLVALRYLKALTGCMLPNHETEEVANMIYFLYISGINLDYYQPFQLMWIRLMRRVSMRLIEMPSTGSAAGMDKWEKKQKTESDVEDW